MCVCILADMILLISSQDIIKSVGHPQVHRVSKRSHLASRSKKNKKIMITSVRSDVCSFKNKKNRHQCQICG
jgi:hypothetical protein